MKYIIYKSLLSTIILAAIVFSTITESLCKPKVQIRFSTNYKTRNCNVEGGWCFNVAIWGEKIIQPIGTGTTLCCWRFHSHV